MIVVDGTMEDINMSHFVLCIKKKFMAKRVRFWWNKDWRDYERPSGNFVVLMAPNKKVAEELFGKGNVVQLEIREVGNER